MGHTREKENYSSLDPPFIRKYNDKDNLSRLSSFISFFLQSYLLSAVKVAKKCLVQISKWGPGVAGKVLFSTIFSAHLFIINPLKLDYFGEDMVQSSFCVRSENISKERNTKNYIKVSIYNLTIK